MWGGEQDAFLEAMAEAAKSVVDYFGDGERALYINVMNRLSVDCDCDGSPAEPDMHDIGILASVDPVALDQACIDPGLCGAGRRLAHSAHRKPQRPAHAGAHADHRLWQPCIYAGEHR